MTGVVMNRVTLQSRAITSREKIDRFIGESEVVRLGMISAGEPYIVPLNYVYLDNTVYFHCSKKGRKYEALENCSRVCLEFDSMHGISSENADTFYTSVVAWGNAEVIRDVNLGRKVLEMLVDKYLETSRKITDTMVDRTCIAAVRIDEVTGKENRA